MRSIVVLLVVAGLADAAACPIYPSAELTPPSGSTLPSNPTLFVINDAGRQIRVESEGVPVPYRLERVTDWIYQLRVDLAAGSLEVHIAGRRESLDARFTVQRGLRVVRSARASMEGSDLLRLGIESKAVLHRLERQGHDPVYFTHGVFYLQRHELSGARVIGMFADGTESLLYEAEDILFELPEPSRIPDALVLLACIVAGLLANTKAREHLV